MKTELTIILCGFAILCASIFTLVYYVSNKSDMKAELIDENIKKASKSCIEEHNGTFTIRFEHGDRNTVTYECTFGGN